MYCYWCPFCFVFASQATHFEIYKVLHSDDDDHNPDPRSLLAACEGLKTTSWPLELARNDARRVGIENLRSKLEALFVSNRYLLPEPHHLKHAAVEKVDAMKTMKTGPGIFRVRRQNQLKELSRFFQKQSDDFFFNQSGLIGRIDISPILRKMLVGKGLIESSENPNDRSTGAVTPLNDGDAALRSTDIVPSSTVMAKRVRKSLIGTLLDYLPNEDSQHLGDAVVATGGPREDATGDDVQRPDSIDKDDDDDDDDEELVDSSDEGNCAGKHGKLSRLSKLSESPGSQSQVEKSASSNKSPSWQSVLDTETDEGDKEREVGGTASTKKEGASKGRHVETVSTQGMGAGGGGGVGTASKKVTGVFSNKEEGKAFSSGKRKLDTRKIVQVVTKMPERKLMDLCNNVFGETEIIDAHDDILMSHTKILAKAQKNGYLYINISSELAELQCKLGCSRLPHINQLYERFNNWSGRPKHLCRFKLATDPSTEKPFFRRQMLECYLFAVVSIQSS